MSGFWAGAVPWAIAAGAFLFIGGVLIGVWAGYGRGFRHAEEEARWAREQARARHVSLGRVGNPPVPWYQALEVAHETEVLEPTVVISPDESSTTAWTRKMAADMDAFLRDLIGGTDEQLREITR